MAHTDPIDYVLSDADRRDLAVSFGIPLAKVPARVTGGELDPSLAGVTFAETIGGHRIALRFEGRPTLSRSAAPALFGRTRKVA